MIFSTLCNGGHLLLSDSAHFIEEAQQCSILPVTPSLLGTLDQPELYRNIRGIFLGGESPSHSLVRKWCAPHREIFNAYGPSEATIACTIARLAPDIPITIGKTMPGSTVLVLDDQLKSSIEGQLFVSGPGLAVGYYQNAELTAEKFLDIEGTRFYQTGDLARQTPHGIEFLGRKDSLVKNRGFLINIDVEVVPALLSLPGVHSAVVFQHRGRLVAAVSSPSIDSLSLRQDLVERYDHFLVPDIIIRLPHLPLNSNSKVDIQNLKSQLDENTSFGQEADASHHGPKFNILRRALATSLGVQDRNISGAQSFWSLGGNSLLAIKTISCLQEEGLTISLKQLFSLPSIFGVSEALSTFVPPSVSRNDNLIPITPIQIGMIRATLHKPPTGYMLLDINMGEGHIKNCVSDLEHSWKQILHRHSIFRTSFDMKTGHQLVGSKVSYHWKNLTTSRDGWSRVYEEATTSLFALTEYHYSDGIFCPVIAFCYVRGSKDHDTRSNLLWLVHHSQVDGWSMSVLFHELQSLLDSKALPSAPEYSDYARKAAVYADQKVPSEPLDDFWGRIIDGFVDGNTINVPHVNSKMGENSFSRQSINLGISVSELEFGARSFLVSSASIFYSAWALLLSAYTTADRVCFGTVLNGRTLPVPSIANIVGPLINFIPIPVHIRNGDNKANMLRQVRDLILEVGDHQTSAIAAIESIISGSFSALFNTALFLEHELPEVSSLPWTTARTDFPEFGITAYVKYVNDQLHLQIVSDDNQYDRSLTYGMLHHFRNIILGLLDPRNVSVADTQATMMKARELLTLTQTSPSLFEGYKGPSSLRAALEAATDQWPNLVCLESISCTLTYYELENVANYLAMRLKDLVEPRQSVAVIADSSIQWIICVVVIMKLAAVYVPLDTKLPPSRMNTILRTVSAKICLIPNFECESSWMASDIVRFPVYEYFQPALKEQVPRLSRIIHLRDIAYTIFTSGSTGAPKGVRVTHEAVLSYLTHPPARMHASPGRRHAQMFSPGFDVNIAEVFGTLCFGATLVLKDPHDPYQHLSRVNATMVTPSFLSVCSPEDYPNLDTILFAGEAVPQTLSERWSGERRVYNSYGPCECTIGALFKQLSPGEPVTLGKPIPRVGVYLLDRHNRPVPQGVVGELCLSGVQVMQGYIGVDMREVSARKFGVDPFIPDKRMYKTGDLAMWTPAMEVLFLGRSDNQVKVRGFRVELEEIENAILVADSTVKQAAALVVEDSINAFVAPETVDLSQLHSTLRTRLPAYACPSRILLLPSLPLNSNQKLDRKALATLEVGIEITKSRLVLSETERIITEIWREIANIAPENNIQPTDDFMTVGGNSLRQIRVAQTLSSRLNISVPLIMVLKNTTLSELASALDEHIERRSLSHGSAPSLGTGPYLLSKLSPTEEEFYLICSIVPSNTFNVSYTVELYGDVNTICLVQAFEEVVATHDVLNHCYEYAKGEVTRKACRDAFQVIRKQIDEEDDFSPQAWVDAPFNLHEDRLLRVAIIEMQGKVIVSVVQHHIITDHTSFGIFLNAVVAVYQRLVVGMQLNGYGHASHSLHNSGHEPVRSHRTGYTRTTPENQAYWKTRFASSPTLPVSSHKDSLFLDAGGFHSFLIPHPLPSATLVQCLSAVALAICSVTGTYDFVICVPYDRREDPGTELLLGCFLDRLPIRLLLTTSMVHDLTSLHLYVESQLHESLSHAIPYHNIVARVGDAARFDIMLTYHGPEDGLQTKFQIPNVVVTELQFRPKGAKFPLLFEFTETDAGLRCDIEYMADLVDGVFIRGMTEVIKDAFHPPSSLQVYTGLMIPRKLEVFRGLSPQLEATNPSDDKIDTVREAFSIALGISLDSVNVNETYQGLGGTSILSLRIHWVLKEKGYEVDLKDVIVGRTPQAIAARLKGTRALSVRVAPPTTATLREQAP